MLLGWFCGRGWSLFCWWVWFVGLWVFIGGGVKCVFGNGGDFVFMGEGKRRYLNRKKIKNWKLKDKREFG